eukprot:UN25185
MIKFWTPPRVKVKVEGRPLYIPPYKMLSKSKSDDIFKSATKNLYVFHFYFS